MRDDVLARRSSTLGLRAQPSLNGAGALWLKGNDDVGGGFEPHPRLSMTNEFYSRGLESGLDLVDGDCSTRDRLSAPSLHVSDRIDVHARLFGDPFLVDAGKRARAARS